MSTVSFIIPTWHYYADPFKHQPYWELYYATQIKKKCFDVNVIDLRMEKKDSFVETINNIPQRDFYFYWIFKTGDAKELYSVVKLLKKKYPESIHAAGGTHVDMCQTECKRHFDCNSSPNIKFFLLIIFEISFLIKKISFDVIGFTWVKLIFLITVLIYFF